MAEDELGALQGQDATFFPVRPENTAPFQIQTGRQLKCGSYGCAFLADVPGQKDKFVLKVSTSLEERDDLVREYMIGTKLHPLDVESAEAPSYVETFAYGSVRMDAAVFEGLRVYALLLKRYDGDATDYILGCPDASARRDCACEPEALSRLFHTAYRVAGDFTAFHAAGVTHSDFKLENVLVAWRARDGGACTLAETLTRNEDPVRVVLTDCSLCKAGAEPRILSSPAGGTPFVRSVLQNSFTHWAQLQATLAELDSAVVAGGHIPDTYLRARAAATPEALGARFLGAETGAHLDDATRLLVVSALAWSPWTDLEGLAYDVAAFYAWYPLHEEVPDLHRSELVVPPFIDLEKLTTNEQYFAAVWWERWVWFLYLIERGDDAPMVATPPEALAALPRRLIQALGTAYLALASAGQRLAEEVAAGHYGERVAPAARALQKTGAAGAALTTVAGQKRNLSMDRADERVVANAVETLRQGVVAALRGEDSEFQDFFAHCLEVLWKDTAFRATRRANRPEAIAARPLGLAFADQDADQRVGAVRQRLVAAEKDSTSTTPLTFVAGDFPVSSGARAAGGATFQLRRLPSARGQFRSDAAAQAVEFVARVRRTNWHGDDAPYDVVRVRVYAGRAAAARLAFLAQVSRGPAAGLLEFVHLVGDVLGFPAVLLKARSPRRLRYHHRGPRATADVGGTALEYVARTAATDTRSLNPSLGRLFQTAYETTRKLFGLHTYARMTHGSVTLNHVRILRLTESLTGAEPGTPGRVDKFRLQLPVRGFAVPSFNRADRAPYANVPVNEDYGAQTPPPAPVYVQSVLAGMWRQDDVDRSVERLLFPGEDYARLSPAARALIKQALARSSLADYEALLYETAATYLWLHTPPTNDLAGRDVLLLPEGERSGIQAGDVRAALRAERARWFRSLTSGRAANLASESVLRGVPLPLRRALAAVYRGYQRAAQALAALWLSGADATADDVVGIEHRDALRAGTEAVEKAFRAPSGPVESQPGVPQGLHTVASFVRLWSAADRDPTTTTEQVLGHIRDAWVASVPFDSADRQYIETYTSTRSLLAQ